MELRSNTNRRDRRNARSRGDPGWTVVRILFLLPLLLAGCQGEEREEETAQQVPVSGGTLRVMSERPGSLDPIAVDEIYESAVVRQVYEGLVAFDADLRLLPGLASSWTISADERTYTFTLRPGVRFHDGTPLTPEDVRYSLERCLLPDDDVACMVQSYLVHVRGAPAFLEGRADRIEGIGVAGERTVRIELEEPLPILLEILAMDQTVVVPKHHVEAGGTVALEEDPIGTGPFRYAGRTHTGGVALARNDAYWRGAALLDSLVFLPIPESEGIDEPEAVASGRVDFAALGMGDGPAARAAGLEVYRSPELSIAFLALRTDQAPFHETTVRQAVLRAIDRRRIQQIDLDGMVPVSGILPPGMPGRDPANLMPEFDPDEAARLLAEGGYREGRGLEAIRIVSTGGGRAEKMARWMEEDLQRIGLDAEVVLMDWRELDSLAVAGELQAFLMSWVTDLSDATSFLYSLFHSEGEGNLFAYRSPTVDRLLEKSRGMQAGREKSQLLRRAQEEILSDAPCVPLYHSSIAYAWRPEVEGIVIGPTGFALVDMTSVHFVGKPADDLAREELR
ncbi:MAG: hypothetical protein GF346_00130 [Candidatus Eisenbacteria bacterium]|nr:hypothetical protein [Candidatus Latescibacterota bacterium]MBD3300839.1 hypothetical protein [Candidatus Eisenbacteria bacterium]